MPFFPLNMTPLCVLSPLTTKLSPVTSPHTHLLPWRAASSLNSYSGHLPPHRLQLHYHPLKEALFHIIVIYMTCTRTHHVCGREGMGYVWAHSLYVDDRKQPVEVASQLLACGFQEWTQVVRPGDKCLYLLSHLLSSHNSVLDGYMKKVNSENQTWMQIPWASGVIG